MARARSSRAAAASPHYRLSLLGPFRLERLPAPGQPSERVALYSRKVESLLAYLALFPGEHAREQLAALLWGDSTDAQARASLRRALNNLRQALGEDALLADRETVQLNPGLPLLVDAWELKDQIGGLKDETTLIPDPSAFSLYTCDLLAEFYDEWITPLRDEYRDLYLATLLQQVEQARTRGAYGEAIQVAQRILASDPAQEVAHQHVMFCYAALGDRTAALAHYEKCKQALRDELGVAPSAETVALYERIKQQSETGSTAARLTNLPRPLTSFIGREVQIQEIIQSLSRTETAEGKGAAQLLTLTGAGGSGKTRLAIQVAQQVVSNYADGVWWVDFSSLQEESLVPQQIAKTLGVQEQANQSLSDILVEFLRSRHLLLVLDNCEHLINACAHVVDLIMTQCPIVEVLATSRESLGIGGEVVWSVPTLSLPPTEGLAEWLLRFEAIRLFVERAQRVAPRFGLTDENALAVLHICQRLDGIPLAVELAAARIHVLSPEQIAARLDDRFSLLTSGNRTALPRQQTLRAAMDWSYDLLSEPERALLRRLSVFAGGCTLEAAEEICGDGRGPRTEDGQPGWSQPETTGIHPPSIVIHRHEVLNLLTRLVNKSLVQTDEQFGEARYRLLETVRQYAREKLVEAGEVEHMRIAHLNYFVQYAEAAEPKLEGFDRLLLDQLDSEHDNLRAAMGWATETHAAELAMRLGVALAFFNAVRDHYLEWAERVRDVLAQPEAAPRTTLRAAALRVVAPGNWSQARRALFREESLAIGRELQDQRTIARALYEIGLNTWDATTARKLLEESLALWRALGDQHWIAHTLATLGRAVVHLGDLSAARSLVEESLALARELGNKSVFDDAMYELASLDMEQGDYAMAHTRLEELLAINREFKNKGARLEILNGLGELARLEGDYSRAELLYRESVDLCRELGFRRPMINQLNLAYVMLYKGEVASARTIFSNALKNFQEYQISRVDLLVNLACVAAAEGHATKSTRLFAAAHTLRQTSGQQLYAADQMEHDRYLAIARAQLDETAFNAAWQEGCAMTLEQAIDLASEN